MLHAELLFATLSFITLVNDPPPHTPNLNPIIQIHPFTVVFKEMKLTIEINPSCFEITDNNLWENKERKKRGQKNSL